jgi:succinate dehydrogenase hydrophobic anchor subunit
MRQVHFRSWCKVARGKGDPPVNQETQQQSPESRRWPLTGRRILTITAIVTALLSLGLLSYSFVLGPSAKQSPQAIVEQTPWVIWLVVTFLIAVITLIFVGLWD